MDTIYRYFFKEMAWLEKAGQDFAAANPGLDTFLRGGGQVGDPHVDRILEGAAFLAARLDKRLDDSLRQVAEDLLGLTFPELMAPQPSLTMVQFQARKPLKGAREVPSGAQFSARHASHNGHQVRLCTSDPVAVCDLAVVAASVLEAADLDRARLRISLGTPGGGPLVVKEPLPARVPILLFWNNLADSCTVYHGLRHRLGPPEFRLRTAAGEVAEPETTLALELRAPTRFEPMLHAGSRAFPGFRQLREFFALPQRFLQLDLIGLDVCDDLAGMQALDIEVVVPLAPREMPTVEARNFLLHTTGACNRWQGAAKPISLDGTREREEIVPQHARDVAVVGVEEVRVLPRGSDEFRELPPFDYFHRDQACYRVSSESFEMSDTERSERWFLELNNVAEPGQHVLVSTELTLCNRAAFEVVGARTKLNNFDLVPDELAGATLTPCTDFVPALDAEGRYWQLVDMISCNLASLSDARRLQLFLQHLNRTGSTVMNSAIRGIREARLDMATTTLRQQPVKLATMDLAIDSSEYLNRGFVELFFSAFHAFMLEFVPLNCLLELVVRDADADEVICRWEPDRTRVVRS